MLWQNNTSVSIDDRVSVLRSVSLQHSETIFDLLMNNIGNTTSMGVEKPGYRNWARKDSSMTHKEYFEYGTKTTELLVELFKKNIESQFVEMLGHLEHVSLEIQESIIDILLSQDFRSFKDQEPLLS